VQADALTRYASFVELAGRVRLRWLIDTLRDALTLALIGAALVAIAGRALGLEQWPLVALAWCALATAIAAAARSRAWPNDWRIALDADRLGLAERVSSAIHAQHTREPIAVHELLVADARTALDGLDARRYRIGRDRRAWLPVVAGVLVFGLLTLVPLPSRGSSIDEAQKLEALRRGVAAIELQPPADSTRGAQLHERELEEVRALREALAQTQNTSDAARAIERTQQRLTNLPSESDYAARRAIDAAALGLQDDARLQPLAQALSERDARAAQQALSDLDAQLRQPGAVSDADRQRLQATLQAAANSAAGSRPELASALRRAASQLASGRGLDAPTSAQLQQLLEGDLSSAQALDQLEATSADLSRLQAATLPEGARLVRATGTPTAYVLVRGAGTPVAVAAVVGQGANGGGGTGPQGSGAGGGAGYGNQPAQGRPSTTDASATNSQPQLASTGSGPATNTYDPVYAPSHLGGEGGPAVQAPGDPTGAGGASVELPQGPLSVGDVRPYDQVYAEYADAARQSAARQPLPPNVQTMVERYFGAIAPPSEGQP